MKGYVELAQMTLPSDRRQAIVYRLAYLEIISRCRKLRRKI